MDAESLLEIALKELDKAHQDISRLIRLGETNSKAYDNLRRQAGGSGSPTPLVASGELRHTVPTSRYDGANALTFHTKEGNYDEAYTWAQALYPRLKHNLAFLRAYRDVQAKRGEATESLSLIHQISVLDKKTDPLAVRKLEGRLREMSGWVPKVPGPRVPVEARVKGRVLHLVKESRPYLSNGFTSRSHHNFVAELQSGLEPIVVTEPGFPRVVCGPNFPRHEVLDGVTHVRLDVGDIDYSDMPNDDFLQMFAQLAYEQVIRYKPSVIHASSGRRGYDTALVGLALKEKTGIPFVYEVRSFFEGNWTKDIEYEAKGEIFNRRMWVEEMCMNAADRILTIGQAMKDELISRGIPSEKIGIIPNAVDSNAFSPKERSETLDVEYGLTGYPTFGYVSNMDHYRESHETLIYAAKELKERGSEFRCVLVGGGPRRPALEQLANRLDVTDRVIFTGSVDHADIPDFYSIIDFFVVPRIAERAAVYVTPLKPYEAMASGRPVITSDLPALREITDAPLRGLQFEHGNQYQLADVLQSLSADPQETARLVDEALKWVRNERDWDGNGRRYVEEFEHVIDGASK
ncbi:glycosyltransferase family 4 protein [Arthrobacter luteolus]|uniref:glycosyltransferase family 4 protein n=1 Tax=Arthrobacter luteolus TaxID=98672 RepID=UPI0009F8B973|nr:glycosyltransferase family 4 protein [Arthrobacter luteolus]